MSYHLCKKQVSFLYIAAQAPAYSLQKSLAPPQAPRTQDSGATIRTHDQGDIAQLPPVLLSWHPICIENKQCRMQSTSRSEYPSSTAPIDLCVLQSAQDFLPIRPQSRVISLQNILYIHKNFSLFLCSSLPSTSQVYLISSVVLSDTDKPHAF